MMFDECLLEQKLPDVSHFDSHVNATQLPVRILYNLKLSPLHCALAPYVHHESAATIWCSSSDEVISVMEVLPSHISHSHKLKARPYSETTKDDTVSHMCHMKEAGKSLVCALSHPGRMLYLWDCDNYCLLLSHSFDQFTADRGKICTTVNNYV